MLTKNVSNLLSGAYDFFGLNQYSAFLVQHIEEPEIGSPSWGKDMGVHLSRHPSWQSSASEWLYVSKNQGLNYSKWKELVYN